MPIIQSVLNQNTLLQRNTIAAVTAFTKLRQSEPIKIFKCFDHDKTTLESVSETPIEG